MQKFTVHQGLVAPMDRENVDTDAIIPKQFLKSIRKTGFGPNLVDEWRYLDRGAPGQDRRSITLAACDVQHSQPVDELADRVIAVQVLDDDVAIDARQEAFTGPLQHQALSVATVGINSMRFMGMPTRPPATIEDTERKRSPSCSQ